MLNYLYSLSDATLVIGFTLFWAGLVVLLPLLTIPFPRLEPGADKTDFVLRIQGTLFTMTGFALAMTLVQAQANFRKVEAMIQSEASHINNLDRLLTRYGDPSVSAIRPMLLDYTSSIVKNEWPAMAKGHGDDGTLAKFVPVARAVAAISPTPGRQTTLYTEMLHAIDVIAEARETRIEDVEISLPGIYWGVVWLAMAILVLASCSIQRSWFRTFFLAGQAGILGALIGVVFVSDHPFKGQTTVPTHPFDMAIMAMKNRAN